MALKKFLEHSLDYTKNQKRLREYIKILKDNGAIISGDYGIQLSYFIIIHNFLLIENKYYNLVKMCNKELNNNLNLPKLNTLEEVLDKFKELYDVNSPVRFSVETLDSIEEIRLFLSETPNIYRKIYFNI